MVASANGLIVDDQPVVKKRRGRRKNVEGVDIFFINRNKAPNHVSKHELIHEVDNAVLICMYRHGYQLIICGSGAGVGGFAH